MTASLTPGVPLAPFGFVARGATPGTATWEYQVQREHFNLNGALHGGVMMALLDTAMGHAVAALVAADGAFNASAQMSTYFLEPISAGTVIARAEVKKCGKRLAVVEATATDVNGVLLATATATHAIIKRKPAPPAPEPDRS
ncbi:MAG TPA: PaaI family thioesterase [Polyangia bacterium]|nr:PaaI family thioesterase [Polyangia bacterium]